MLAGEQEEEAQKKIRRVEDKRSRHEWRWYLCCGDAGAMTQRIAVPRNTTQRNDAAHTHEIDHPSFLPCTITLTVIMLRDTPTSLTVIPNNNINNTSTNFNTNISTTNNTGNNSIATPLRERYDVTVKQMANLYKDMDESMKVIERRDGEEHRG